METYTVTLEGYDEEGCISVQIVADSPEQAAAEAQANRPGWYPVDVS